MTFDSILFDLDGTLTDSKEGIVKCIKYALAAFGIEENDEKTLNSFLGPPLAMQLPKLYGFDEQKTAAAVKKYRERFTTVGMFENSVYDGIEDMLKTLKNDGKTLGVATAKPTPYAKIILDHFGLLDYFTFVEGSDLEGEKIDKIAVVNTAVGNLLSMGKSKDGIVMVGDRWQDINAANLNGIRSVGVEYGYAEEGELKNEGATFVVNTVAELTELLKG